MQPYPYDQHYQNYPTEQEYRTIPEDQANPVFFRGRRGPEVYFPIVIPLQPFTPNWGCNPWNQWNPWNPWNPWNQWGGGGWGGW
ncbi:hypothetical protein ACFSO0_10585 [Brevibacillus sp. GCM10020057]|uniref:hypothetical protein n=1 Tax=Brevibacillus sp. GCM10020057 TaxID=3317327 RepID=UPI003633AEB5